MIISRIICHIISRNAIYSELSYLFRDMICYPILYRLNLIHCLRNRRISSISGVAVGVGISGTGNYNYKYNYNYNYNTVSVYNLFPINKRITSVYLGLNYFVSFIPYFLIILSNILNWIPTLNENIGCKLTDNVNIDIKEYWLYFILLIGFSVILDGFSTEMSLYLFVKLKLFKFNYQLRLKQISKMNQNMLLTNLINQRQSANDGQLQQREFEAEAQQEEANLNEMPMASSRHFERPRRVIYIVLDLFWMIVMSFVWFGVSWLSFVMDYQIRRLFV